MEPFNVLSKCVKCGCGEASVKWTHSDIERYAVADRKEVEGFRVVEKIVRPESLIRTCVRCGYLWEESPLDAAKEPR